jgi:hypothetical protein
MRLPNPRKRKHQLNDSESDGDMQGLSGTRRKPKALPLACTIHRVHCTQAENHKDHPKVFYFEDTPRLFEGDCKASALRGEIGISDISEYLAARPHLKFVMYRIYDCKEYHATMDSHFRCLERPKNPFVKSLLPFFYLLDSDGEPAKSNNEAMLVSSEELLDALHCVTNLDMAVLEKLDQPQNTRILATRLYHYRWVRDDLTPLGELDSRSTTMAIEMFDFIEDMFGIEYDEADALFAKGLVTEFHLPKLFSQNDLLVTMQRGEPCAYSLEIFPEDLHQEAIPLDCWAWRFDGQFWKFQTSFNVEVPSNISQMPITDLSIYPLKYAIDDLRGRLEDRGRTFWSLRNGSYVCCNNVNLRKDLHAVSAYLVQSFEIDYLLIVTRQNHATWSTW